MRGGGKRRPRELNENQLAVMAELAAVGGRMRVRDLRESLGRLGVPESSTLGTLVKRGSGEGSRRLRRSFISVACGSQGKKHAHEHDLNEAQMEALGTIAAAMEKGGFRPHLLYGVTGSGKTTVYFAAMRRALGCGEECAAAGSGDWADSGDGGAAGGGV